MNTTQFQHPSSRPTRPARSARRTRSIVVAALVIVTSAVIGLSAVVAGAALISLSASPIDLLRLDPIDPIDPLDPNPTVLTPDADPSIAGAPGLHPPADRDHGGEATSEGLLGEADGVIATGVDVFDDKTPAVAKLNPDLLAALRQAATDAADDGIEFVVNSGWRSPQYQEQLLREAIATYGTEAEAARWVATADTSAHVSGDAVDIGPDAASAWLAEHGADYGLCQIYGNEPWHYELRPDAIDQGCPPMYPDPTYDPRMQK